MQQDLQRGIQILILMTAGLMTDAWGNAQTPPTRDERNDVQKRLDTTEGGFKNKNAEVEKTTVLIDNLNKSIDALEKTLAPLAGTEGNADLKAEVEKMQTTLGKLKTIRTQSQKDLEAGQTNSNKLRRELQTTLKEYFDKADPKMVATRYGLPFDGVDFGGTSEYMNRTNPDVKVMHYGLGAEHTWDDSFWWKDTKGSWHTANLKAIAQHEQVTTRDIYDMAQKLLAKSTPGIIPPVGRAGLTVNDTHLKAHPEAYRGIFGNKSFAPSVLNNSTRWFNELHDPKVYRDMLDLYTRGEDCKTFKVDGASVTYGLPTVGTPILCNSAGNNHWDDRPNFTIVKNFYPNHMNIGVTAIPALENANRRNDKAKSEIEDYSSGCEVDLLIQRPRWNADGTPVRTQYLNPKYREVLEDNLWKMVGKPKPKTPKDLDDVSIYPPELVKALYADLDKMAAAAVSNEGTDAKGLSDNLRGTSFSSPTAAGVVLAARIMFPEASPAEVMDAMMSSCEPMYNRKPTVGNTLDDVMYLANPKTGWRFAPKGAGYGEFTIRDDANEKNPDSWVRMCERLKAMEAERMRLTKNGKAVTSVTVGEGANKRTVVIDGKPLQMTIEMPNLKNTPSDSTTKNNKAWETKVMEAFEKVQMYNDLSFMMDDSNDIVKLIKEQKYNEALEKLKKEVIESKIVSDTDPYYVDAVKAVKDAEDNRSYTYSVTVPPNHDMCMTLASMRLKFQDGARTDRFVMLESPDGRMIPVTMSQAKETFEVGSTSGFMRQSAVGASKTGTWKIHTQQLLDTADSSLVLSGTERNLEAGIVDVRETVLAKIEEKEAKQRTTIPAKNLLTITDPHKHLRVLNGVEPAPKEKKGKSMLPASYEEQRDYLQALLDGSELRKGGFLPKGVLYREGLGERPDKGKSAPAPGKAPVLDAVQQLFKLFSMSTPQLDDPLHERGLGNRWGEMALATEKGELPMLDTMTLRKPLLQAGFFKDLTNPEVPYWQRKHRQEQIVAAREPSAKFKTA